MVYSTRTRLYNHIRVLCILFAISLISSRSYADEKTFAIWGRVQDATFKTDLPNAWIWTIGPDGERIDSVIMGELYKGVVIRNTSEFGFFTTRQDSTYVFEVGCKNYTPQTVVYHVTNVGARENHREMPIIYLERAPHKLGEVMVTASKIKFYHRGDTLVYNADAFQLAEGSMLDVLINQLPGTKLSSDGRISVNGEFVETLLLDGKPFFDNNNRLMLDNISAYMVKDVEIYNGQTETEKWMNIPDAPKHLTMNVKLKKEYNMGWIFNAQSGYGTNGRYLGRIFASWFTPTARVGLIGSLNNLNDTRTPGSDDNWTPEQMPSYSRRYQLAGLTYSYTSTDNKRSVSGDVTYENIRMDKLTTTDHTNFLPTTGNTYDYSQTFGRDKSLKIHTSHQTRIQLTRININTNINGSYNKSDNSASATSASFNREQSDLTMQSLMAIYSNGSAEQLESIINRSVTRSDGTSKNGNILFSTNMLYKMPRSNDIVNTKITINYKSRKDELWDDYNVAAGMPISSTRRCNYTYNSPNHDFDLDSKLGYVFFIKQFRLNADYNYMFHTRTRDSYMYALDRLADIGIYGSLPSGYIASFDPGNSFTSSLLENKHSVNLGIQYMRLYDNGDRLTILLRPNVGVLHSHLNYYNDGKFYPVRRSSFVAAVSHFDGNISYIFNRTKNGGLYNDLTYLYTLDTNTPDLLHMVDVINTSDPLNIDLGNSDLKNALHHKHTIQWRMHPAVSRYNNTLRLNITHTSNALVRGYAYDINTGVRYNRTYNANGNYTINGTNTFSIQFGRRQQFTLTSTTEAAKIHSVDMVGVIDGSETIDPTPSKVNTRTLGENLKLTWQIGRQSLSLNGNVIDRHTTSTREGFAAINATHYNYGLTGRFVLPCGFGIDSNFTFYTRRGYGLSQLDTTDAVWNARVSYTPNSRRWIFTIDAFDLLHRLSNVSYVVTAAGRTVTMTNTLPRYILASIQYRFNINPQKQ